MEDILVPIALFAMIAAIVIVPRYLRSQERMKLQETMRAAIEKGQPIPPEVVEALTTDLKPPPSPARDLRRGAIWLGVGAGLAAFGLVMGAGGYPDATIPLLGVAALPGFLGLAFIAIWFAGRDKART